MSGKVYLGILSNTRTNEKVLTTSELAISPFCIDHNVFTTITKVFVTAELRADVGSVGEVVVRRLDTSDLTSVRTFAKEVLNTEKAIHVLVSGDMTQRGRGVGRRGEI